MKFVAPIREKQVRFYPACAVAALMASAFPSYAADCGAMAGKTFGPATITAATSVTPPSGLLGQDPPKPQAINAPFCRVEGVLKPSADSDINFEVWLPPATTGTGNSAPSAMAVLPAR